MKNTQIHDDRLPLWWLVKAANMPQWEIKSVMTDMGLYIYVDDETGQPYTSRSAFGEALRSVIAAGVR